MTWFDRIKNFYDQGYWTKKMVSDAVVAGKITNAQYQEITGEIYSQ